MPNSITIWQNWLKDLFIENLNEFYISEAYLVLCKTSMMKFFGQYS